MRLSQKLLGIHAGHANRRVEFQVYRPVASRRVRLAIASSSPANRLTQPRHLAHQGGHTGKSKLKLAP
jgi:hypothetical protein